MLYEDEQLLFSMDGIECVPESSGHLSETCGVGQVAEMAMAIEAFKRGFAVFFPIGHAHKADLVIWKPPSSPLTIQVKKATYQSSGAYKFMVGAGKPSCAANPNNYGLRYTKYQKGDFDFLCAYIEERDEFVFYKLDEIVGRSSMRWRPDTGRMSNNWHILESNTSEKEQA